MDVNSGLEMPPFSGSSGAFLYWCDFEMQSFSHGVGDAMSEVSQYGWAEVWRVAWPCQSWPEDGYGLHRNTSDPKIASPSQSSGNSHFPERFFQRPSPHRFQLAKLDLVKAFFRRRRHGRSVVIATGICYDSESDRLLEAVSCALAYVHCSYHYPRVA
jgi:hypothetical protein